MDPSAVVCASRRAGEAWFVFEQPDRGGAALAALGEVATAGVGGGPLRGGGGALARAVGRRGCRSAGGPRRRWPVAVGGFAFAPDGGGAPHWAGFEPASLIVPEVR